MRNGEAVVVQHELRAGVGGHLEVEPGADRLHREGDSHGPGHEATDAGRRGADFDAVVNGWGQVDRTRSTSWTSLLNGNNIQDYPAHNLNLSYFNNPDVNTKLAHANPLTGAARYEAYGDLDVEIMTDYAPLVPIDNPNALEFNSARVGGYVLQPSIGKADLNTFFIK